MRTSSSPLLALLLTSCTSLTSLLVGCSEEVGGGGGDPGVPIGNRPDAEAAAACTQDIDCPFGQVCREGSCRASDGNPHDRGCRSDADCGTGRTCALATGRCVETPSFPMIPPTGSSSCADGQTRQCGTKIGRCDYGVERCSMGRWTGTCEGAVEPMMEICDGSDNDCDGDTDEGFAGVGQPCAAGRGACRVEGMTVCGTGGSTTTCSAVALDPTGRDELCGNGVDDDCDGNTDEGFMTGGACNAGVGACARAGVTACSQDRLTTACNATPGTPAARELCGGAPDDDCNGMTDEQEFPALGTACAVGVGACRRTGIHVCTANQQSTRCSATAGPAAPAELCGNNIDDDCDGMTDEGFEMRNMACTVGMPPCQSSGTYACSPDLRTLVCNLPPATAEQCNSRDDDNDTCVDEGFDVGTPCAAGVGACRQTGTKVCLGDGSGTRCNAIALPPTNPELCGNAIDDNCDNMTDEGFPNLGNSCTAGQGICLRNGAFVCSQDRRTTVCDAVAGAPNAGGELCGNNLDDDCDGARDEGFDVGAPCTAGQGICQRSGTKICAANGLGTVCGATPGPPNPGGELCGDNMDNDCDGMTDEGFTVNTPCTVGQGICERSGTTRCTANRLGTECSVSPGAPNPNGELCGNTLDDDCDGFRDEGFGNLGNACTAGAGACTRSGTYVCSGDRLSTVCNATPGMATAETCDNIDNDCNSAVDNGCDDDGDRYCDASMTLVGRPTICPLTTGAMTTDCNDSDRDVHPGAMEICNDARDQDCDGNPNNGCAACNPAIDADFDGSNQCLDCDDTNGAVKPGVVERCDGIDNNCDMMIDEGFDVDGDSYTTCGTVRPGGGIDTAYIDCADDNPARHPFACELCALGAMTVACGTNNDRGNNVDEDCDGYLDETCRPCDNVDRDGDGVSQCDGDCMPSDGQVSPMRAEACDGKDTDCNQNTTENCNVGDRCNWTGTPVPDICADRLICVESLGAGGQRTGNYTCTSFCNGTPLGMGLGDGCTAMQTCASRLTPTGNLHGCAVSTDFGVKTVGQSCQRDNECRSGRCNDDSRAAGPPMRYCTDYCGNDSYCAGGTTCQAWSGDTGQCWTTLTYQNADFGAACSAADPARCRAGPRACVEFSAGNRRCSRVCCEDNDCAAGYHCSLNGNDTQSPTGGYDTVPVCWPDGSGMHNRPAGAACTSNGECDSEFCDRTLNVCVSLCCNDATCPAGLSCESARIIRRNGHTGFSRVCVNQTPAGSLEARP